MQIFWNVNIYFVGLKTFSFPKFKNFGKMAISGGKRLILVAIDELRLKMSKSGGYITNSGGKMTISGRSFTISGAPQNRFPIKYKVF